MLDHSFGEPDQNAPEPPQPTLLARPRAVPLAFPSRCAAPHGLLCPAARSLQKSYDGGKKRKTRWDPTLMCRAARGPSARRIHLSPGFCTRLAPRYTRGVTFHQPSPGQQGRSSQTSACHASESFAGAASTHVLETQRVPSVARSRNERAMECCFESEQTSWFGPTNAASMPTPECGAGVVSSGERLPKINKK